MSRAANYFDHASTTPLDPRVLEAMMPFLTDSFGNANSLHQLGREAAHAVEVARTQVADAIGAEDPSQIIFTCGATEANNWVLHAHPTARVSPFEHSSIYETARSRGMPVLANEGLKVTANHNQLVSVMRVNNEIGTIWTPKTLGSPSQLHQDITQAVGKLQPDLGGVELASLSSHKFYGPKGVGALYVRSGQIDPFLLGGEQEQGMRSGTLNVPGIVGMGKAAELASESREADHAHATRIKSIVLNTVKNCKVNGGEHVSPFILSLSFEGLEGESLVLEADRAGFAISSGAACSSRSTEPSHVLKALETPEEWLRGTVRISFGRANSEESTQKLAIFLLDSVEKLRTMR